MTATIRKSYQRTLPTPEAARAWSRHADEAIVRADAALALGLSPTATLSELIEPWIRSRQAKRRSYSRQRVLAHRRVLGAFAERWGVPIDQIQLADLEAWVIDRYGQRGRKGLLRQSTIKGEVDQLLALVRWASGRPEYCRPGLVIPLLAAERLSPGEARQPSVYAPAELARILRRIDAERPDIALPLYCIALTGARPASVCALRWSDYRLPGRYADGRLTLRICKGGNPCQRRVAAGGELHGLLCSAYGRWRARPQNDRRSDSPIFYRGDSGQAWSVATLSSSTGEVARRIGVAGFTPYSVKHSMVTAIKAAGLGSTVARHYASHRDERTQRAYDHTDGQAATPALHLVAGFFRDGLRSRS